MGWYWWAVAQKGKILNVYVREGTRAVWIAAVARGKRFTGGLMTDVPHQSGEAVCWVSLG